MSSQNSINNTSSTFTSTSTIIAATGITAGNDIIANGIFDVQGLTFDGTNVLSQFTDVTSWTPVLTFGASGTTGITYTEQTGHYFRLGSLVFIRCNIELSSKGTSTGAATIAGLPLAVVGTVSFHFAWNELTYSTMAHARCATGVTAISLYESASGGTNTTLQDTDFVDTTILQINGFYSV